MLSEPMPEERPSSADSIDEDVKFFLRAPRLSRKVRHPQTGRIISFSEVGDPEGFAVFCCVGMGLTRYVMAFYDELAASLKLRLITPDRPGVGESESDPSGTPLSWPDDVLTICNSLGITKFSLLAHSAGAIYALATALRMPQHIRGRVHLLAPWIPPSQMSSIGLRPDAPPAGQLPKSQRFLRALPTSFLKVANSAFMSGTSAGISRSNSSTTMLAGQPANKRRRSLMLGRGLFESASAPSFSSTGTTAQNPAPPEPTPSTTTTAPLTPADLAARRRLYDARLTLAIWSHATHAANPALDLLVCLERHRPIGFRYVDITRAVVVHHGSRDTRVPLENVKWLGRTMRRCEVRVLEGEGHGLMASAVVMGRVLEEVGREWEEWMGVVEGRGRRAGSEVVRE
ncbi:hypothetical protein H2199_003413 [Coniosporium tulheliwenetii]|uniref:Uncharacterized protein n=1 Tax=Coniosporium tulheliwenetii TaxID=3383036 RepID=A0ACC2ZAF2_9PEZI|nr:hypothetical protein H2199_003413 [Cladosporium sp. JES 115]